MKSLITSGLLLSAGLIALAGATEVSNTTTPISAAATTTSPYNIDAVYNNNAGVVARDPLQMGSMAPSESPRHRQEKAHLMKRMSRKHGTWNTMHPRYRLLEALYGFTKYRERNMAELSKWRSQYNNVSKAQKKVRCSTTPKRRTDESRRWRKQ